MKKIKKIGLFLLLSVNCYAQINALDIKSAQSYEMERYGNIPINLNTGGLDLSIPIFESNIPGTDKNFSIGLNYNSSGFIPAKKSNYVGSNWFLNFGGAITREVKGIPDDRDREGAIKGFLIGLRKYSKTNADIYTGNFVQGRQDKYQGTIDILGNGYGGFAELESDKYNFNFMGKSGYFYIGNNGTPLLFSNDNNMKIDILGISGQTNNICSPNVSQIKITDGEGNVYYFGGEAENLEVHYEITRAGEIQTPMKLGTDALYHITAWGLRKVVFTNGREINFYYKTNSGLSINNFCSYRGLWNPGIIGTPLEPLFDLNISMNEVKTRYSGSANVNWGGYHMWGENSGFSHNYDVYINLVKKIIPERIAADSFEILFDYQIYDKAADKDHKSYKLSNIKINNKNSEISNIDFDYYRNGFYFF